MGVVCRLLVKGNRVECREMEGSDAEARMRSSTSRVTKCYRASFVFATRAWLNEQFWWGKRGGGARTSSESCLFWAEVNGQTAGDCRGEGWTK